MLEQRIQQQFFESADLQYQSADALGAPTADAAQALVAVLTSGARVLAAGLGAEAALSQIVVAALNGRFERDRPGLAALALGGDGVLLGGLLAQQAGAFDPGLALARQIETLGQPGDLLLAIGANGDAPELLNAVRAAHDKEMSVIVLSGRSGIVLREMLDETDVLIAVPHERRARVLETQLLVLHCLCDAVDLQLLGDQD